MTMSLPRQLLHNLACRLRWARQELRIELARSDKNKAWAYQLEGAYNEAYNSFQAAKQIYFENLEDNDRLNTSWKTSMSPL